MNTLRSITFCLLSIFIVSCSDDDGVGTEVELSLETETFENLHAPQQGGQGQPVSGEFTKFDFETGMTTENDTDWDIAFRGTTIAVNGGEQTGTDDEPERTSDAGVIIESGTFSDITQVPENEEFVQDSPNGFAIPTGSGNGWYNYDFATNIINPVPGKIFIFKTSDGRYAKLEILSYYKDAPTDIDPFQDEARYYTFRYTYNPNEGQTNFD